MLRLSLCFLIFCVARAALAIDEDSVCDGKPHYETKDEDTCSTLTSAYDVPLEELIKLNPSIDCRNLTAGTIICVPPKAKQYFGAPGSVYPVAGNVAAPAIGCSAGCQPYRVVYGDSCGTISAAYCALPTLYQLNPGLNCGALAVGQPLCVPTVNYVAPPPPPPPAPVYPVAQFAAPACGGFTYRVLAGDSCGAIATAYSCALPTLYQLNPGLNCGTLAVGSSLCLPAAPAAPVVPAVPAAPLVPAVPAIPAAPALPVVPAQAGILGQLVPGGYYPNGFPHYAYGVNPCLPYGPLVAARLC